MEIGFSRWFIEGFPLDNRGVPVGLSGFPVGLSKSALIAVVDIREISFIYGARNIPLRPSKEYRG